MMMRKKANTSTPNYGEKFRRNYSKKTREEGYENEERVEECNEGKRIYENKRKKEDESSEEWRNEYGMEYKGGFLNKLKNNEKYSKLNSKVMNGMNGFNGLNGKERKPSRKLSDLNQELNEEPTHNQLQWNKYYHFQSQMQEDIHELTSEDSDNETHRP
jgi:hypothetical protein